ncbi:hypothetical protein [Burkholderia sp. WAC0059]|uniref:hypothetical protein n=1 Tax=Burkholderia sp. WAC0059 TaxID=2066022 RepID=UPI0021552E42|nr:hypothetical protein [Burkholderia sp. WAC0059]
MWQQLSPVAAVERLMLPYVEYLWRHVDFLPLMDERPLPERDADFVHTIGHVLDARLPGVGEREAYGAMLYSIAVGRGHVAFRVAPGRVDFFLRGITRLMSVYLVDIEGAVRVQVSQCAEPAFESFMFCMVRACRTTIFQLALGASSDGKRRTTKADRDCGWRRSRPGGCHHARAALAQTPERPGDNACRP